MDIDTVIRQRRAVYTSQFSGERVPDEFIWKMLRNANWAPNHYHTEPWRFKVFTEAGLKGLFTTFANLYKKHNLTNFNEATFQKYLKRMDQVSHAIVIVLNKSNKKNLPEVEEVAAVACAVQNMWLTVSENKEFGGYWGTGKLVYLPDFGQFLKLENEEKCLGVFYVGKLKENPIIGEGNRKPIQDKVTWVNTTI